MRLLIVGIAAMALSCSSSSSGGSGAGGAATFGSIYANVIKPNCTPCHAQLAGLKDGKLDMSAQDKAYANLVGVAAAGVSCTGKGTRVVAGNAAGSLLYQKVTGHPPCGDPMPQGLPSLSSDDTQLIQSWIQGGALNN
jgi:hypothetical protein